MDTRAAYHQALLDEIHSHAWAWTPETLYFGGGTPSLMPLALLEQVIGAIPSEKLAETTLECAPGTVTQETAEGWRHCGINRVSLGVQSFNSAELRQTGRRHDAAIVDRDMRTLRAAGITNINIDLIAGLPEQTARSWQESLDWIEHLNPPHVSVYIFEIDEDSRLGKELIQGGIRYGAGHVPREDLVGDLYENAVERLAALGIHRYEISNFAKAGSESRHNLKYWLREPYIGFGLDAHSFDGHHRWNNPDTLSAYLTEAGPLGDLTETDPSEEHFFVGLRLSEGIEPTDHEWSRFARPIARWLESGLLERSGARLRLTPQGVLLSNEVLQEFVNA